MYDNLVTINLYGYCNSIGYKKERTRQTSTLPHCTTRRNRRYSAASLLSLQSMNRTLSTSRRLNIEYSSISPHSSPGLIFREWAILLYCE